MPRVVWKPDGEGVMGGKWGTSVTFSNNRDQLKKILPRGGRDVCILCMCMRMYKNTSDKTSAVKMLISENRFDLSSWPL